MDVPPRALVVGDHADADGAARVLSRDGMEVIRPDGPDEAARLVRRDDLLVVDEWTAETASHVVAARAVGAHVTVVAEIVLDRFGGRVVGVTGTAGKTTTCHLLASILRGAGRDVLMASARAGNAWPDHTLLDVGSAPGTWLVAELTSTHLCHMDRWRGADVGVLTGLWADHVELHGSVDRYVAAKLRLLERSVRVVVPDDCEAVGDRRIDMRFARRRPAGAGVWSEDGFIRVAGVGAESAVIGRWADRPAWVHPDAVLAACAAAIACGVEPEHVMAGLVAAPAPPHRMDVIGVIGDVRRIDDSIAATPPKLVAALREMPEGRTVLVAGGLDRVEGSRVHASDEERRALDDAVARAGRVARVVVPFGPAAGVFAGCPGAVRAHERIDGAIDEALACARPGETVIVSPMFPVPQADRDAVPALLRRDGSADA